MNRVSIVLDRNLSAGQACNVSAIVMGQLARLESALYSDGLLKDGSGVSHASIQCSTVVLKAKGSVQLYNFVDGIKGDPNIRCIVFTSFGQSLHNSPLEYEGGISGSLAGEHSIVGVVVFGEHNHVLNLTKKFSVFA
ncbi:MAG: DUF2000 family protein [Gammaproteobacteria bacterium]|nr:DUF2000 family protein [Gammaproteobacteria bacterium]MCP5138034.1 DUF2000 family protein [Gammaproteobacteria bacterium]